MCRICTDIFNKLKPELVCHIYHRFPGSDFRRIKVKGCSFLYYNNKTRILKVFCWDENSLNFWFPNTGLTEEKLSLKNLKGTLKTLTISPLYILRSGKYGDYDEWVLNIKKYGLSKL